MVWAFWVVVEDEVKVVDEVVERMVDVAVRARERVHRLPLTVVMVSEGVAMQNTHS